jgi:predicted O-methyltransferase YrrM
MEKFGKLYDSESSVHSQQMLNITRETGSFLSILVHAIRPKKVLEIGTSNGYSTLWIADAAKSGGRVTTVEISGRKSEMAEENIAKSGLAKWIDLVHEDVRTFLKKQPDESYDFLFLDAERSHYLSYWLDLKRVLKTGSLLVVDNALSPHPEELTEFFRVVEDTHEFVTQVVHIGKGEFLAVRLRA